MHANVLIYYSLGSVSVLLTCAVAILNGICYATSKSLPTDSLAIELAIVGLHAMNCVELVVLALLLGKDVKYGLAEWTAMKTWVCCCIGVFIFITTAATAAATAWRNPQSTMGRSQALIISQCVTWAASVFHQGLFCGFILVSVAKRHNDRKWRYLFQQDMESRYGSSAKGKGRPVLPSLHYDRPLQSVPSSPRSVPGRLTPVRSFAANVGTQVLDHYSGRTLLQQEFRGSSLDLASPEFPLIRGNPHVRQGSHDTCSGFSENHARKGHKSHSEVKSLDSVILQPSSPRPSLPTAPSPNTDPAKQVSAKQCTPSENHIHPLFRSGSASPPPTPAPGTVVTASPVAGQTISARMVGRMKSSPSIQASGERSRSPLTESVASVEDAQEPESPRCNFVLPILGADSQKSVSGQGREYDLNESPFES